MNVETFGVVVVIGLAVFGSIYLLESADSGFLSNDGEELDNVYVDKSYGKLGESASDDRTINFGDFTVGEGRGDVRAYRNEKATISDSLLDGEKIVFRYNATQPRTGEVTFEVLGRRGQGDVYVKVNGEKIFSEALIATGTPEVTVPQERLSNGINRFEIGVKRDSFLGSSSYTIEEVEARVNDRRFHDYRDTFQIYSHELEDYVESPLTFTIDESIKSSPLTINVNGQTVYSREIVSTEEEVDVTPENADLRTGANEISFETDRPAKYSIKSAQLTMRYVGNVERQNIVFDFDMSNQQLNHAEQERTDEYIEFDYQNLLPAPRAVRIELNDYNDTIVPDSGENRIRLPEGTLQSENSFEFRSNGTYQMDRLRVYSEGGR